MRDRELFDHYLKGFVPPTAFDAHAHLFRPVDLVESMQAVYRPADGDLGIEAYRRRLELWMGQPDSVLKKGSDPSGEPQVSEENRWPERVRPLFQRPAHPRDGLFFGLPHRALDVASANDFVFGEVKARPTSRGLLVIRPQDDPAAIEAELDRGEGMWAGFKPYHVFASCPDTLEATVDEFVPEWAWELADRRSLAIMLHLVRRRALADASNQAIVRARCMQFPRAKLILAHAARGFCCWHTVEAIESLRGLDNVFFDTSAICETPALEAILRVFGPTRLLFGTDFPVSEFRGRCVSVGDGFLWLDMQSVNWEKSPFAQPTCIGVESLLAVQQACRSLRLKVGDVELIFGGNARQILELQDT